MRASVYVQFWRYFRNYVYYVFYVYQKPCEHVYKVLRKYVDRFLIYEPRAKLTGFSALATQILYGYRFFA